MSYKFLKTFWINNVRTNENIRKGVVNHISNVVLIIYCGSPFAAAEVAAKRPLAILNGPFVDAVAVSLE